MATTLKSVNYNVAMTFIFNYNNNDNAATKKLPLCDCRLVYWAVVDILNIKRDDHIEVTESYV